MKLLFQTLIVSYVADVIFNISDALLIASVRKRFHSFACAKFLSCRPSMLPGKVCALYPAHFIKIVLLSQYGEHLPSSLLGAIMAFL